MYGRGMRTRGVHHDGITDNASCWRSVAAWLGVLAFACGRAENPQGSSLPTDARSSDEDVPAASDRNESSAGDDDTNDAGASLPSGDGAECPVPRLGAPQAGRAEWARDPATGNCCRYANSTAAPTGWLRFDYEAACRSDCLCSALEGFAGDFEDLLPVRETLACRCTLESCPSTREEAEQSMCAVFGPPAVQRLVGCGMVVVVDRNGFSGYAWVFEQPSQSGAAPPASVLVGAAHFSDDLSSNACTPTSWSVGRDFFTECDDAEVVACQLCGESPGPDYPPCK